MLQHQIGGMFRRRRLLQVYNCVEKQRRIVRKQFPQDIVNRNYAIGVIEYGRQEFWTAFETATPPLGGLSIATVLKLMQAGHIPRLSIGRINPASALQVSCGQIPIKEKLAICRQEQVWLSH